MATMLLARSNAVFHVETHLRGLAEYSSRAGVALLIIPVRASGGRIVPNVTHNRLVR